MSLLNSKCALIFIIALSHLIPLSGPSVLYGEITNSDPLIIPDKDEDVPGVGPIRRTDWFRGVWKKRRSSWLNEKKASDQGGIVFLGDSITQGWGEDFKGLFGDVNVVNRGISGDTSRGLLLRLKRDVIDLSPAAVVIMIGANDLAEKAKGEIIFKNVQSIIGNLKSHNSKMPIILCETFPCAPDDYRPVKEIRKVNQLYAKEWGSDSQVKISKTYPLYAGPDGSSLPKFMPDRVHPNLKGYEVWAGEMKRIFTEIGLDKVRKLKIKKKVNQAPNTAPLNPFDSMKLINLPDEFSIELVASEPNIEEPVALTWDGNGRMYVVEMRGYMQTMDGVGAKEPVGRVSCFEDTNSDGKYDKHTIFVDGLVEPRAVLSVGGGLLVGEPSDLWFFKDADKDGKADTKEKVYDKFSLRDSNVEHKANGLTLGIDNWVYVSQHGRRYQFTNGKFINESVPRLGQWGLARNDEGRFLFSSNSNPAMGFFITPDYLASSKRIESMGLLTGAVVKLGKYSEVWPSMKTSDLQSGLGAARASDGTLRNFTSACGQSFFRGDRLGEDVKGNYFICEPVGRLVRRSKVNYLDSGHIELSNLYEENSDEFITSSDGNFRPVNTYTGPDGCLYIVDMYRGVIQEKSFMTPYLIKEIKNLKYDKNVGRGRIYRVLRKGMVPGVKPELLDADSDQLLVALEHSNGWWRDMAQNIIVSRKLVEVVPNLEKILIGHSNPMARLHALWTLEGLSKLEKNVAMAALNDNDDRIISAALRAINWSSPDCLHLENIIDDSSPEVVSQVILAVGRSSFEDHKKTIIKCILKFPMNERILRSVVAVTPKDYLSKNEFDIIDNSLSKAEVNNQESREWSKRWQNFIFGD